MSGKDTLAIVPVPIHILDDGSGLPGHGGHAGHQRQELGPTSDSAVRQRREPRSTSMSSQATQHMASVPAPQAEPYCLAVSMTQRLRLHVALLRRPGGGCICGLIQWVRFMRGTLHDAGENLSTSTFVNTTD
jgi:hypothetical protein